MSNSFLASLFTSLSERGRQLLKSDDLLKHKELSLLALTQMLVSRRGEATGVALATEILARFKASSAADKLSFLLALARDFGIETAKIQKAASEFTTDPTPENALKLHTISEPKRQEVLRRLNLAPKGTYNLIKMREEIFPHLSKYPELAALDEDFRHLFSSWFNRGFLSLKQIDWQTPANILEKIIKYEAVHEIRDWNDLRQRIEPQDRRLFAFFHPQINDEPLIFVEVALTDHMPDDISDLLMTDREEISPDKANTACFYSISNCQEGLRGISFGHFLIKQVVENLSSEFSSLKTFVTLSPIPTLAANLTEEFNPLTATAEDQTRLKKAVADYLINQKTGYNRPRDPVARFHLGNGAILERVNFAADLSDKGLRESYGMMVNYLYTIKSIVENHENFAESGIIAASSQVRSLLNK